MSSPETWKIVLIDDEEDIREVLSISLQDAGWQVHTAEDGQGGLALAKEIRPQIVITDIRMPKMTGIQVLEALKKSEPNIEVIVATAFGDMDLAIRALQLDASDFVTKPIDDQALHLALKRARDRFVSRKKIAEYTALLERNIAAQAKSLHQDKMMSLGRLAASVVHEINNPLSGILNYLQLMQKILKQGPLQPEKQNKFVHYLDLVQDETTRCSQIVSGLLAFSRRSPPAFGKVDVADLLNRCVLLSRHKLQLSDIALEIDVDRQIPAINGDFNQLQQCMINLIFNAADAMPDGGRLVVEARYEKSENAVVIRVTDTGIGIDEKDLPHIFEPFYSTKGEGYGVGLGLSTVFGIVEHHMGTIDVTSTPGKGTVFFLRFPLK